MLPLASTRAAPNDWKIAPAVSTIVVRRAETDPEGKPALWQASAALRNASSVQLSAFGGLPAGYIASTSMPACCFIRSMREHGPLIWLPVVAGTASHWPPARPRYSTVWLTAPFCLINDSITSLTGSRQPGMIRRPPGRERQDVVTAARLRLGGDRQELLVALRRDVVDRDLDLFLRRPFLDERGAGVVGARHPVIPEADRELAGGVSTADIWRGDEGGGGERSGLQCSSPGES